MPAIITHDSFGKEVFSAHLKHGNYTRDEYEAFLLGNQGPDPLFFLAISPRWHAFHKVGGLFHKEKPDELLCAMKEVLEKVGTAQRSVAEAYACGFLCHYLLDSRMHPFVYFWQYALCDAGIEGLTRKQGSDVHAAIESEFDEMVLTVKVGESLQSFNPSARILRARGEVLDTVSWLYAYVAQKVYGKSIDKTLFKTGVFDYRLVGSALYSPTGFKRNMLLNMEESVRGHSYYGALSHRSKPLAESQFDNKEHMKWENPYSGEMSTRGFWDIYEDALAQSEHFLNTFMRHDFGLEEARQLTKGLNFSGKAAFGKKESCK